MAKKVTRSEAASATRQSQSHHGGETKRARRGWLLFACVAVLLISATAGIIVWRQHAIVTRVQTALPARPELAGRPAILAETLARSEKKTKSSDTALDGVTELGRLYHANGFTSEAEACWNFLRLEQPAGASPSGSDGFLGSACGDTLGLADHPRERARRNTRRKGARVSRGSEREQQSVDCRCSRSQHPLARTLTGPCAEMPLARPLTGPRAREGRAPCRKERTRNTRSS